MFLVIVRTFKQSLLNLRRNGWLSIAATSVLVLSLYMVGILYIITSTSSRVLQNVESKINISVYFKSDVTEDRILTVKQDLEKYSEIKTIEYVTKDQALDDFKRNNADEPVILESLKEIGSNPLLASLVIKANNPDQYEIISSYISGSDYKNDVSRLNYGKNKIIIEKLNKIIRQIKKVGSLMAVIFAVVSMLIIFNTIRITIYVYKHEIEVMRLVGASNMFIRLPFIFEGIIYGIGASLLATLIIFLTIKFINPYASIVITSENLMSFYLNRLFLILGAQATLGVVLGVVASWFAMRKYLKI